MNHSAIAYIGLGSNLADPASQINSARTAIASLEGVQELAFSSLYQSLPMGPPDQPDYINAVMAVATGLSPVDLLRALQAIENDQGRVRKAERWGARTLDLDILTYGDQVLDLPDLTIPHPGLAERAFVLYPWFEIAPHLVVPGQGALADLLAKCPLSGLKRLGDMNQKTYDAKVKPLTVNDLAAMKLRGEKISCLTAYDASFGALIDQVGIDIMLVGDSLGMVVQGHGTTLPVTVTDMVYHARCVSSAKRRAFVIADLPFMSYTTPKLAAKNAARLMQSGGAQMVKLEGARHEIVRFLADQGVPVCGHLGLLPQMINQLGGYKVQGKDPLAAEKILADAHLLQQAGAGLLVLECVPAALAKTISTELGIPVIGIGAGVDCDGQVLVLHDMLNIGISKRPRFSKNFMQGAASIEAAIFAYHQAVKQSQFPSVEHSF